MRAKGYRGEQQMLGTRHLSCGQSVHVLHSVLTCALATEILREGQDQQDCSHSM